jgi:acyl-CoA thioesterase-1
MEQIRLLPKAHRTQIAEQIFREIRPYLESADADELRELRRARRSSIGTQSVCCATDRVGQLADMRILMQIQPIVRIVLAIGCATVFLTSQIWPIVAAESVRIVALGDSLTAGYGLARAAAFPARLEAALRARGHAVEITNAGVSGDTTSGGLARLDSSVPSGTDVVILALGANDGLRGVDPNITRAALDRILRRLNERGIAMLFAGMYAPRNMRPDFVRAFDAIFPDLAARYDVVYYPFFLDGVVGNRMLNQGDGVHPTAAGVDTIVGRILPKVEELIARVKAKRGS